MIYNLKISEHECENTAFRAHPINREEAYSFYLFFFSISRSCLELGLELTVINSILETLILLAWQVNSSSNNLSKSNDIDWSVVNILIYVWILISFHVKIQVSFD